MCNALVAQTMPIDRFTAAMAASLAAVGTAE
jgi:hypothetical protein